MTFDYERNDDGTSTIKYNIVWDSKEEDKKPYQKYDEKEVIPQIISNNSSAYLLLLDNRIVKESEYYKEMEEEKKKKELEEKNNMLSYKNFDSLTCKTTQEDTLTSQGKFFSKYIQCDQCGKECLSKKVKVFGICDHVCCSKCLKQRNIILKELGLPNLSQCATKECLVSSILPSIKDSKIFKKYCKYYAAGKYDKILNHCKNNNN
uniref:RING-type domain-containing protein n=1 Tax=Strongyloides stercoralis TaxID=6248 RepID=A0A0K0ENV6_STRER